MATSLLTSTISNVSSFQSLALLICHLFIDGDFRIVHVAYDQNIFDKQLTIHINSICPQMISWKFTDINSPVEVTFDQFDSLDNILQLIFLCPIFFEDYVKFFSESNFLVYYYRVFILPSTNENETENQFSVFKTFNVGSSALLLYYDLLSDEIFMNWMSINDFDEGEWRPTTVSINGEANMFDRTFGVYEAARSFIINVICVKVKFIY